MDLKQNLQWTDRSNRWSCPCLRVPLWWRIRGWRYAPRISSLVNIYRWVLGRVHTSAFCRNLTVWRNKDSQVCKVVLQQSPCPVRWSTVLSVFHRASKEVTSHRYKKFRRVSGLAANFAASWQSHVSTPGAANTWWITARSQFARIRAFSTEHEPLGELLRWSRMLESGRDLRFKHRS